MSESTAVRGPTIDPGQICIEGDLELSPAALAALVRLLADAALREIKEDSESAA